MVIKMVRKSTSDIIYPKFPNIWKTCDSERFNIWRNSIKKIIENQINSDSKVMGEDLACWFDIRPLLEALK